MNDPEKFRLVAASLCELANSGKSRQRPNEALALAAVFERLASEAEEQREAELDSLFGQQHREH